MRPNVLRLTLQTYELATLISTARWVADGCQGQLPEGAVRQLRRVLEDYGAAVQQAQIHQGTTRVTRRLDEEDEGQATRPA
ncbi:MAG: hypothetical protein AB7N76_12350 [Planctomycetota bacterium]